jgi:hypothetical protein
MPWNIYIAVITLKIIELEAFNEMQIKETEKHLFSFSVPGFNNCHVTKSRGCAVE